MKRATVIPGGPEGAGKGTQIPAQPGSASLASLAGDDSWPSIAHVPGTGSEPDRAPLEAAKRLVRAPVAAEGWESDAAYRYGAALHVGGFFWEAHEVWEAVWKACPPNGIERRLLRGLIQLANAAVKIRMGRGRAAVRLLREAEELLREAAVSARSDEVMGIALAPLGAAAHALAAAVEQGGDAVSLEPILQPLQAMAAPLDSAGVCIIVHAPGCERHYNSAWRSAWARATAPRRTASSISRRILRATATGSSPSMARWRTLFWTWTRTAASSRAIR